VETPGPPLLVLTIVGRLVLGHFAVHQVEASSLTGKQAEHKP
jgi:hypothetical protein